MKDKLDEIKSRREAAKEFNREYNSTEQIFEFINDDVVDLIKAVKIMENALNEVKSGSMCSACSCACHIHAENSLTEAEKALGGEE